MATGPQGEPSQYFVIDTSSLLEIRRVVPRPQLSAALRAMTDLVDRGEIVFPAEVDHELERFRRPDSHDPIGDWVAAVKRRATRFGPQFDYLRRVLADPQAKRVVDPVKAGVDEADPHVLALALALHERATVVVVAQETRDRPDKLSMATACGVLRLVRLPVAALLYEKDIWRST